MEKLLPQMVFEYQGNDPYMIILRETIEKWEKKAKAGAGGN